MIVNIKPIKISKSCKINTKECLIMIVTLIFVIRYFMATPIEKSYYILDSVFISSMILFLLIRFILKDKLIYTPFPIFISILTLIFFIYPSIRSYIVFGQPIYLGLLSSRGAFLLIPSVWIYISVIKRKIKLCQIKNIFLLIGWVNLFIYIFIYIFVDKAYFLNSLYISFDPLIGYRYKFQCALIILIGFYYLINYIKTNSISSFISYIIILVFFFFILKERGLIVTFLAISFIITISMISRKNIYFLRVFFLCLFTTTVFLFLYFNWKEHFEIFYMKLNDSFIVVRGNISNDASANIRLIEAQKMVDFMLEKKDRLILGVGNLSRYFERERGIGGFESFFGYLYPSDVGVIGVIFVWGIAGSIITYFIPFFIIFIKGKKYVKDSNILVASISYYLIFSIISSLYTGGLVFDSSYFTYFCLGIILANEHLKKNNYLGIQKSCEHQN